jgi:hypothetical protein
MRVRILIAGLCLLAGGCQQSGAPTTQSSVEYEDAMNASEDLAIAVENASDAASTAGDPAEAGSPPPRLPLSSAAPSFARSPRRRSAMT